jgi:hypothetical protein
MYNTVYKFKYFFLLITVSFCLSEAQAMVPDFVKHMFANSEQSETAKKIIEQLIIEKKAAVVHERRQANAIDAMVLTLIAWCIEKYMIIPQNSEWVESWCNTALEKSVILGGASWLTGELFEAISEKVYKKLSGKTLREAMGSSEILGIKIDHKRLARRIVSLTALVVILYVMSQKRGTDLLSPSLFSSYEAF